MDIKRYYQAVKYLESLRYGSFNNDDVYVGKELFIKRMAYFLELLGDPQSGFEYVHVAGTSGKGSVCLILNSILTQAGKRTGVFISPFLTTTIERIMVNDRFISVDEFSNLVDRLKPYIKRCQEESPYGRPSYFETVLAIALLYFKKEKCTQVILEAGIGGSFDATNIIKRPKVTVITNIGLDHTHILGNTKKKIALDKAGMIKEDSHFFTAEKDKKLKDLFVSICRDRKAKYHKIDLANRVIRSGLNDLAYVYKKEKYETRLTGKHQVRNCILAAEVAFCLGVGVVDTKKALKDMVLAGRLEVMQKEPLVILDGAHNPDKILSTVNFLKETEHRKLHLVITLAKKKNAKAIFKKIMPLTDSVCISWFSTSGRSSESPENLKVLAKKFGGKRITIHKKAKEALQKAFARSSKNDMILITGSFHLAGELRKQWYKEKDILKKRKIF